MGVLPQEVSNVSIAVNSCYVSGNTALGDGGGVSVSVSGGVTSMAAASRAGRQGPRAGAVPGTGVVDGVTIEVSGSSLVANTAGALGQ